MILPLNEVFDFDLDLCSFEKFHRETEKQPFLDKYRCLNGGIRGSLGHGRGRTQVLSILGKRNGTVMLKAVSAKIRDLEGPVGTIAGLRNMVHCSQRSKAHRRTNDVEVQTSTAT